MRSAQLDIIDGGSAVLRGLDVTELHIPPSHHHCSGNRGAISGLGEREPLSALNGTNLSVSIWNGRAHTVALHRSSPRQRALIVTGFPTEYGSRVLGGLCTATGLGAGIGRRGLSIPSIFLAFRIRFRAEPSEILNISDTSFGVTGRSCRMSATCW